MKWFGRKWRSVSFRSGLIAALLVGIITALGSLLVVAAIYGTFTLATVTLQLAATERGLDQLSLGVDPAELDLGQVQTGEDDAAFWAVVQNTEVVRWSGPFVEQAVTAPFIDNEPFVQIESSTYQDIRQGYKNLDDREWFILEGDVSFDGDEYTLITASSNELSYWGFVRDGLPIFVVLVLVIGLVSGLLTGLFSRSALRSVEKMRREVENISRESLDRRVPTTEAGDEVDKLAKTMNDMLGRLENSSAQQSEFLAAASHELRSPVAGLLAQLDVAVAYPDRVDTAVLLPKLRHEAERLQLLVNDLLYLGRSEAQLTDRPPPTTQTVSVDTLLSREVEHQQTMHPELSVTTTGQTGLLLAGQERDIARAIRNLTDNAARHATSAVEVGVTVVGQMASIAVRDDGAGVDRADADRIFDRFVRLDEARGRDDGGSGLGLAIVGEIARRHGGGVSLIDQGRPGATFQLLLPLARP